MVAHLKSENLQVQLARQENDDIDDASFFDPRVVRKVMGALLFVCFVFFSVTVVQLSRLEQVDPFSTTTVPTSSNLQPVVSAFFHPGGQATKTGLVSSHFCFDEAEGSERRSCKFHNICFEPTDFPLQKLLKLKKKEKPNPMPRIRYYYQGARPPTSFGGSSDATSTDLLFSPPYPFVETNVITAECFRSSACKELRVSQDTRHHRLTLHRGTLSAENSGNTSVVWHADGTHMLSEWRNAQNIGHILLESLMPAFENMVNWGALSSLHLWKLRQSLPHSRKTANVDTVRYYNLNKWPRLLAAKSLSFLEDFQPSEMHCFRSIVLGVANRDFLSVGLDNPQRNKAHGRSAMIRLFRNYIWQRLQLAPTTHTTLSSAVVSSSSSSPSSLPTLRILLHLKRPGPKVENRKVVGNYLEVEGWMQEWFNGTTVIVDRRPHRVELIILQLSLRQTPREQIAKFTDTHVYVTTAGSGMYYANFMPDNTAVLHFPPCSVLKTYQHFGRPIVNGSVTAYCSFMEFNLQSNPSLHFRSYPATQITNEGDLLVEQDVLLQYVWSALEHVVQANAPLRSSQKLARAYATAMAKQYTAVAGKPSALPGVVDAAKQRMPKKVPGHGKEAHNGEEDVHAYERFTAHFCAEEFNAGYRMCRFRNLCMDVFPTSLSSASPAGAAGAPTSPAGQSHVEFLYFASETYADRLSVEHDAFAQSKRNISADHLAGFVELGPRAAVFACQRPVSQDEAGVQAAPLLTALKPALPPGFSFAMSAAERMKSSLDFPFSSEYYTPFLAVQNQTQHRLHPRWLRSPLPLSSTSSFFTSASTAAGATPGKKAGPTWLSGLHILTDIHAEESAIGRGFGADRRLFDQLARIGAGKMRTAQQESLSSFLQTEAVSLTLDWLFYQGELLLDTLLPVHELLSTLTPVPFQKRGSAANGGETKEGSRSGQGAKGGSPYAHPFTLLTTVSPSCASPAPSFSSLLPAWLHLLAISNISSASSSAFSSPSLFSQQPHFSATEAAPILLPSAGLRYTEDLPRGRYCLPEVLVGTGKRGFSSKRVASRPSPRFEGWHIPSHPKEVAGNFPSPTARGWLARDFRRVVWEQLRSNEKLLSSFVHPTEFRRESAERTKELTVLVHLDAYWVQDPATVLQDLKLYFVDRKVLARRPDGESDESYSVNIQVWPPQPLSSNDGEDEGVRKGRELAYSLSLLARTHVFVTTPGVDAQYAMFLPDFAAVVYIPACLSTKVFEALKSSPSLSLRFNWLDQRYVNESVKSKGNRKTRRKSARLSSRCLDWETGFLSALPSLHLRILVPLSTSLVEETEHVKRKHVLFIYNEEERKNSGDRKYDDTNNDQGPQKKQTKKKSERKSEFVALLDEALTQVAGFAADHVPAFDESFATELFSSHPLATTASFSSASTRPATEIFEQYVDIQHASIPPPFASENI